MPMRAYPFQVSPEGGSAADQAEAREIVGALGHANDSLEEAEALLCHENPHVRVAVLAHLGSIGRRHDGSQACRRAQALVCDALRASEREGIEEGLLWTPVTTVAWCHGRLFTEDRGGISWSALRSEIARWVGAQETPEPLTHLAREGFALFRHAIGEHARVFDRSLVDALFVDFLEAKAWDPSMDSDSLGDPTFLANPHLPDELTDYAWQATLPVLRGRAEESPSSSPHVVIRAQESPPFPPHVVTARKAVTLLEQGAKPPTVETAEELTHIALWQESSFMVGEILACPDWPQDSVRHLLANSMHNLSDDEMERVIRNPNVTRETIRVLAPRATGKQARRAFGDHPWMLGVPEVQKNLLDSRGGAALLEAALAAPTDEARRAFVDRLVDAAPGPALKRLLEGSSEEKLVVTDAQAARLLGSPDPQVRRLAVSAVDRMAVEPSEDVEPPRRRQGASLS